MATAAARGTEGGGRSICTSRTSVTTLRSRDVQSGARGDVKERSRAVTPRFPSLLQISSDCKEKMADELYCFALLQVYVQVTKNYSIREGLFFSRTRARVSQRRAFLVSGVSEFTGQSIGSPTALPGSGEAARGLSPLPSSSPGPGRAIGNPFDSPVSSETPGMHGTAMATHMRNTYTVRRT